MSPSVVAALGWVTLVWGTGWLTTKLGLGSFSPFFLAGSRYVISAALVGLIAYLAKADLPRGRREWVALLGSGGLMAGVSSGFVFWGQTHIHSGLSSLLFAAMPLFTALLADRMLPGERLTTGRLLGIVVGLVGVAIVSVGGVSAGAVADGGIVALGALAVLVGALTFSAGLVWLKRAGGRFNPLIVVVSQAVAGATILLPLSFVFEPMPIRELSAASVGLYAYLTLVQSCLTQAVYMWLVRRVQATQIAYISCVVPVIAVAIGALVLAEPIGPSLIAGGLGTVIGLYLINRSPGTGLAGRVLPVRPVAGEPAAGRATSSDAGIALSGPGRSGR